MFIFSLDVWNIITTWLLLLFGSITIYLGTFHTADMVREVGHGTHKKKQKTILFKIFLISLIASTALTTIGKILDKKISDLEVRGTRQQNKKDLKDAYNDYKKDLQVNYDAYRKDLKNNFIDMNKALVVYGITLKIKGDSTERRLTYQIEDLKAKLKNGDFNKPDEIDVSIVDGYGDYEHNPTYWLIDSLVHWSFYLTNEGNSIAKITGIKTYAIKIHDGLVYIGNDTSSFHISKDLTLSPNFGTGEELTRGFKYYPSGNDSVYVAIKIDYSNENGTIKKTYKDIYLFDPKYYNRQAPPVQGRQYERFNSIMRTYGYW